MTAEAIFTEALALPSEQRAQLAEQLRLSLRAPSTSPQPPIPGPEGSLGDHPLFEEWLAAVAAYRKQREAEEEALEAEEELAKRPELTMALFVFDTDTLSLYQHDHPQVLAALAAHANDKMVITTITVEEQLSGWYAMERAARSPAEHATAATFLIRLVNSWKKFDLVPYTVGAVGQFKQLVKAKLNVGRNDLKIASIALELGATVVTRNRRDFGRVPGLVIEDWSV